MKLNQRISLNYQGVIDALFENVNAFVLCRLVIRLIYGFMKLCSIYLI